MNYTEFFKLVELLANDGYKVEVYGGLGLALTVEGLNFHDVAINEGTYGYEKGLLEGYMGCFSTEDDDVIGYLTAEKAYQIITKNKN